MRKVLTLCLSLLFLAGCSAVWAKNPVFLVGCSAVWAKNPDAAQVGEALCRLYVQGDSDTAQTLKDWDTETIALSLRDDLYQQICLNLSELSGGPVDDTLSEQVAEANLEARRRIPVEVELLDGDNERAELKFTVGALDISGIDEEAARSALASIEQNGEISEDTMAELINNYAQALISGFAAADPSADQNVFQFTFVKKDGAWLPEDLNRFIEKLGQSIRK